MSDSTAKLFRRQSGQMQAVSEEAKEILEVTKAVMDKLTSDPPPALKGKLPPGAGLYKVLTPGAEFETLEGPPPPSSKRTGSAAKPLPPVPRPAKLPPPKK